MSASAAPLRARVFARLIHFYFRLARGLTMGVRGIVLDGAGGVLLVRHTYIAGWHLPGGGVETGESCIEALARELAEEGNISLAAPPRLHGLFFNTRATRRDHVAVYVVRQFTQSGPRAPDREIAEARFFPLAALPDGTDPATRARLAELADGGAPDTHWFPRAPRARR